MLNNIFNNKTSKSVIDIKSQDEVFESSISDTFLSNFIMEQEMLMTEAVLINDRAMFLGTKDDCVEIVTEGFNDFLDSAVEFFKAMLEKIKEFFGKMFLYIQVLMGNTKEMIKKYRHVLIRKDSNFNISGYEFTIDDNCPNLDRLNGLITEYNKDIQDIKNFTVGEINERRRNFMEQSNLDGIRGEILGIKNKIPTGELRTTTHAHFRNGDEDPTNLQVDSSFMAILLKDYEKCDKLYKDCVKEKQVLETQVIGLKKFFDEGSKKFSYDDDRNKSVKLDTIARADGYIKKTDNDNTYGASVSNVKLIDVYYKYRYTEAREIGNTVMTIMELKCRALKDQLKQADRIIKKWIFEKEEEREEKK